MDQAVRNQLQRFTQDARRLLEAEFAQQLEGTFDILPDGTILAEGGKHLDETQKLTRQKLVDAIHHRIAGGMNSAEAVGDYTREVAFTLLNRFVALNMLEARGLVQQCVSKGDTSSGFKEFAGLAPGLSELPDKGFHLYLECLFDELSVEVKILFDRRDPASLLWLRRQALIDLLALLNQPELEGVWGEDETIGWVYQYFNSQEERRQMREESSAPRNSHELAVRNQFFTPRYVVEFLTDNTLGRIWYEMRKGQTKLRDQCRYLVRRPKEIFLNPGEQPPLADAADTALSQEELLKKPVYIPHRERKDPRDLKILDPACGSGHFLLYCFELLLAIYEEAWREEASPKSEATGSTLHDDFSTIEVLRGSLAALILQHNLHGIDIDPRCAQIAAFALWMRAQRAYNNFGLSRDTRPAIRKSNIVIAEPMPGEKEMLDEFVSGLKPALLGQLVRVIFERMRLAGEAGSLLKIEQEIQDAVAAARRQYLDHLRQRQKASSFLPGMAPPKQTALFDFAEIDQESFWNQAEDMILAALRDYSGQANNKRGIAPQLFTRDTARGFAYIDLCRKCYDIVLMNPPFGDASGPALSMLDSILAACGRDIGACFVQEAMLRWAPNGKVGVLLATAPWFKPVFKSWRECIFFGEYSHLEIAAHFGGEVLDDATVTASPLILNSQESCRALVFRLTRENDLEGTLLRLVAAVEVGEAVPELHEVDPAAVCVLPGKPFCYWMSSRLRSNISILPQFEGSGGTVRQGTATADEPRFSRAWWEVAAETDEWMPYTKSSTYSPFWDDITWVGSFGRHLEQILATGKARVQGIDFFGRAGVTYPSKAVLGFNPRLQPKGCGFGHSGSAVFSEIVDPLTLLGFLASRPVEYLLSLFIGELQGRAGVHPNHYEVGTIQRLPWPGLKGEQAESLRRSSAFCVKAVMRLQRLDEPCRGFVAPLLNNELSIRQNAALARELEQEAMAEIRKGRNTADDMVAKAFGFQDGDRAEMEQAFSNRVPPADGRWRQYFDESGSDFTEFEYAQRFASWILGVAFGRYQIVAGMDSAIPSIDSLLDPPRKCCPGMLQNEQGLPLTLEEFLELKAANEWHYPFVPIWEGILVDDLGHPLDIAGLFRQVLAIIWKDRAQAVEFELCDILGIRALRDYFRKSSGFFEYHIRCYSKSRRKAPIYWCLTTPSNSYSIWLYYQRPSKDMFYKILNDFVKPKLDHEERTLNRLRLEAGAESTRARRDEIDNQEVFVAELKNFREEVERIAPLWNPDLNDGVIINFAPLWRLVPQHKAWQKECKDCWDALVRGVYDWAHLAMHLWPERVVPKCQDDASLAIAHGLDDIMWEQCEKGKWRRKPVSESRIQELITERTKPAVKAALQNLLSAAAPGGAKSRKVRQRKSL